MTLRMKLVVLLIGLGCIVSLGYSLLTYRRAVAQAHIDAQTRAGELIDRSVQMFLVSTKKFHDAWQASQGDPTRQKEVLSEWTRTIFAVDEAVIHDFGQNTPRVRLIGDEQAVGYRPLGGSNTQIQIPFEREAVQALRSGQTRFQKLEDGVLRISVPLMAQAHRGCAECHFATVESLNANMEKEVLLGTLNAYIPMQGMLRLARDNALAGIGGLGGIITALITAIYFFLSRYVVKPIHNITRSLSLGVNEVTHAASQVGSTSQSLAEGASEQAAGFEETASSLQEMASMTRTHPKTLRRRMTMQPS